MDAGSWNVPPSITHTVKSAIITQSRRVLSGSMRGGPAGALYAARTAVCRRAACAIIRHASVLVIKHKVAPCQTVDSDILEAGMSEYTAKQTQMPRDKIASVI